MRHRIQRLKFIGKDNVIIRLNSVIKGGVNMNQEELERANELVRDIECLEMFLWSYDRAPLKNKLSMKTVKYKFLLKRREWTPVESEDYDMDKETENRIISVLKQRLAELREELAGI